MSISVDSLVRVGPIPPTLTIKAGFMAGQVGFVEELSADGRRALVQGLAMPGRPTGRMAWLPVTYLTIEADAMWTAALVEYRRWFAEVVREHEDRQQRWQRQLERVASKYSLTVAQVLEIGDAYWTPPADEEGNDHE